MADHTTSIRRAGLLLGLLALLALFAVWLALSPAFEDGARERTIITRFQDALAERLRFATGTESPATRGKKTAGKTRAAAGKSTAVTGTGEVAVLDERSRPIRDAVVRYKSSKGKLVSANTDATGKVRQKLEPGRYALAITHKQYSALELPVQEISAAGSSFAVRATLKASVTIKGKVLDQEGKPVAGAMVLGRRRWLEQFSQGADVYVDDASYRPVATDKNGDFKLEAVSIGENTVEATMAGYAPFSKKVDVSSAGVDAFKVTLERPATISGRVVDESMNPVSGVQISALEFLPYQGPGVTLDKARFSTRTTTDGVFMLKRLFTGGAFSVQIEHPGYATMQMGLIPANSTALTWVIQRGGEISGRVEYIDRPSTAAHVLVQAQAIVNGTTQTRVVMSGGKGTFTFERLPYGAYELTVEQTGIVSEPRPRSSSVKDRRTTNVLVQVYQAARLSGKIIDGLTETGITDSQVKLRATYGYGRTLVREFKTTAGLNGLYEFDRIPAGLHLISATADGYLPAQPQASDPGILLQPGGRLSDFNLFMSRGGIVRGMVQTPDGEGIADAQVQLYPASGSNPGLNTKELNMQADGSGYFEFRDFPIGEYLVAYVSATKEGFAKHHSTLIELTPKHPEAYTKVEMTAGGVVTGRVTDKEKAPVPGVKVSFASQEFRNDPTPSGHSVYTNTDGFYILEKCSPGKARLTAERKGFVTQAKTVTVNEGQLLSNQNFRLDAGYPIAGFVTDYNGKPIADARVLATPVKKTSALGSGSAKTNGKGEFLIESLGLGDFRLEASFTLKTPDGSQQYTFINPSVASNSVGIPIDCDLEPALSAAVKGQSETKVDTFKLTLSSRLETQPEQLFRFSITRQLKAAGGFFRILNVPRGLYKLEIEAPGYELYTDEEVVVGTGLRTELQEIRLQESSAIIGEIISATSGKPVNGASIRVLDTSKESVVRVNRIELGRYKSSDIIEYLDALYDDDYYLDPDPMRRPIARVRGNVTATVRSDYYGKFKADLLPKGQYTLAVEHPMYRPAEVQNVTVGRDETKDTGRIELHPGGVIRGRVRDVFGNGISNAAVAVKGQPSGRGRARTDVAGNFELRGIDQGDWTVTVRTTYNNRTVYDWQAVQVRMDSTSYAEFTLDTDATVAGSVVLPNGTPAGGYVRLYVIDETGTVMDDLYYTGNLRSGAFTISNIPTGNYFCLVSGTGRSGAFSFWQMLDASRGESRPTLRSGAASIAGTAMPGSGAEEPVPGAAIQLRLDVYGVIVPAVVQNLLTRQALSGAKGGFSFNYLQAGTYRVWAGADNTAQLVPVDASTVGEGQRVQGYRLPIPGR